MMIRVRWDRAAAESRCARIGLESTPGFVRDLHNYDVNAVAVRERARADGALCMVGWVGVESASIDRCPSLVRISLVF